ncbi:MAG: hypothetical protein ABIB71_09100 [Candidatus Woesearchaeota archaeon]
MFLLTAIVSVIGLAAGAILARISPEELNPGDLYFCFFRKIVLTAILVTLALNSGGMWQFMLIGLIMGFFVRINYLYFGLALALCSESIVFPLSTLIFIYGIPTGTLLVHRNLFRPSIIFIALIAFFLPLPLNLLQLNAPMVMSLCFGALIHTTYSKFMEGRLNSISI